MFQPLLDAFIGVTKTHTRAHETRNELVFRLLLATNKEPIE